MVKVPGSATPHRIECDWALVNNHAMLIFGNTLDAPIQTPLGNVHWETVAIYHSGKYEWARYSGLRPV